MYPLQYIETSVVNSNSNSNQQNSDTNYSNSNSVITGGNNSVSNNNTNINNTKVVWASSGSSNNVVEKVENTLTQPQSAVATAAAIYTSLSGQTATIIPASALQQAARGEHGTVHLQPHAQIVHHAGNAYLVQSTGTRLEDDSPNLSHTTKASPVTVQWLCENYETADGVSLPRSTLYNHYLQHCQQEKLEPMNQASFGKLIRSVFYGLRTRRLGTRGNSKYHYYGIRIKPNSPLNHYVEDHTFAMRQFPSFHRQNDFHWRTKYSNHGMTYGGSGFTNAINSSDATPTLINSGIINGGGGGHGANTNGSSQISGGAGTGGANAGANTSLSLNAGGGAGAPGNGGGGGVTNQHSNYLGESTSALPNLGDIVARAEIDTLTETQCQQYNVTLDEINMFCQLYLDHSDTVLGSVVYLNFKFIENHWQDFWRTSSKPQNCQWEDKLSKVQLLRLLKIPQVQKFLQLFDNVFYQSLVEVLIPNVLRPIPSALTQSIRHFAKSLEGWMSTATMGLPAAVISVKMSCVCALAQTLRRHTSLNHLAQAARAVLKNTGQITQMLTDLNRVDFTNVQEQASWVCSGCDSSRVDALQHDFKRILQQQASLEEWAVWLDRVVTDYLEPHRNTSRYPAAAHNFILRWSFYSSMVIRDLTLRSAASFGSFHLIRLLYDEYIYYLVEQKVAEHLDLTPVAVTGDIGRQMMSNEFGNTMEHIQLQVDIMTQNDQNEDKSRVRIDGMTHEDNNPDESGVEEHKRGGDSKEDGHDNSIDSSATQMNGCEEQEDFSEASGSVSSNTGRLMPSNVTSGGAPLSQVRTIMPGVVGTIPKIEPQRPPSILGSTGVRKTVNVTTFGDPLPLPSSTSNNALLLHASNNTTSGSQAITAGLTFTSSSSITSTSLFSSSQNCVTPAIISSSSASSVATPISSSSSVCPSSTRNISPTPSNIIAPIKVSPTTIPINSTTNNSTANSIVTNNYYTTVASTCTSQNQLNLSTSNQKLESAPTLVVSSITTTALPSSSKRIKLVNNFSTS